MLTDLLRGKPRDITPKSRPDCFNSMHNPLILNADSANEYLENPTFGDEALEAIRAGKPILIRVPNADGGKHTAIYSPVLMYQVPNFENRYLYLFFLRDEKQDLSSLNIPVQMPTYGELKLLLSQEYNSNPLETEG